MATDLHVLLDELVNRAQTGERLLPWPELTQELAFLAFVIDADRTRLAALEEAARAVLANGFDMKARAVLRASVRLPEGKPQP